MIRDAPVLLLDEPTTGLDAESTERVLAPLRRLMAGRTTLMISHNLLTVTDADRIVFLEDGRVDAVGAHADLLTRSPGYARLYRLHHPGADVARAAAGPRSIGRHHRPAIEGTLPARAPSTTPPATAARPHRRTAPTGSTRTRPPSGLRLPLAGSAPRTGHGIAAPGRRRPFPVPAQSTS